MKGISVVICSYNGINRIKTCLDHLIAQQFQQELPAEIIFVDNRSTDETYSFVDGYFEKIKHPFKIQMLREERPGKAYALELGYNNASYEYIITCDDDNWLQSDYFQTAFTLMEKYPEIGLLGCKTIAVCEESPPSWFFKYKSAYVIGEQAKHEGFFNGVLVWGAGMVFRKSIWLRLRQCNFEFTTGKDVSKAVGEDTELSKLVRFLGYKFYYTGSLILHHWMPKGRITWPNCLKMFEGFGRTGVYMAFLRRMMRDKNRMNYHTFKLKLVILHLRVLVATIVKSYGVLMLPARFYEGKKFGVKYAESKGVVLELLFNPQLKSKIYLMNEFINKLSRLNKVI